MTELLDLCYDVLMHILQEINMEDLAACAQTSWAFNSFIRNNKSLYRIHYLRNFDDPRRSPSDPEPDWLEELPKLVKCRKILQSDRAHVKQENFRLVASTMESLITMASSHHGESLNKTHLIEALSPVSNITAFLHRSSHFIQTPTESQMSLSTTEDYQLSAKLHCLFGIPSGTPTGRRVLSTNKFAKARVYDLTNYTNSTAWGPFREDGSMRVDWEMMEAIMIVLGYNSNLCCRKIAERFLPPWNEPFKGVIQRRDKLLSSYSMTLLEEPEIPLDLKDPYGISGIWNRIVCFLDYTDLWNFNFASFSVHGTGSLRPPINAEEAIRHLYMSISVTSIEPPGRRDHQSFPVVQFAGRSRSLHASWDPNANSKIKGSVRMTPEGEVRWTTISIFYGGEERWKSEGIQVGGRNCKRGVMGTWFDRDQDPQGPAGPTAFWKASDKPVDFKSDEEWSETESDEW